AGDVARQRAVPIEVARQDHGIALHSAGRHRTPVHVGSGMRASVPSLKISLRTDDGNLTGAEAQPGEGSFRSSYSSTVDTFVQIDEPCRDLDADGPGRAPAPEEHPWP